MNRLPLVKPGRTIAGNSAILLPFLPNGAPDWTAFGDHVTRTYNAGLIPAINMDTGYGPQLNDDQRKEALSITNALAQGRRFVAGAQVRDQPGDSFDLSSYEHQVAMIRDQQGVPVIVQSYGLCAGTGASIVSAYQQIGTVCDEFIAFELGKQFADFGAIYELSVYRDLMIIPSCSGAKHSSLSRDLEFQRLAVRDTERPEFQVYTGNDLAIDMVMFGSDYLLGLSTFAPEEFALRDRLWNDEDANFYELNDVLQYLGAFAFRDPVPSYKHSAAQFLRLRGWIDCDVPHPSCAARPNSDVEVLGKILEQMERVTERVK